jgi:general secretion pathway protein A
MVVFIAVAFLYLAGWGFTERTREIPVAQPAAKPWVKAPAEPTQTIVTTLKDVSPRESARAAFDALAEAWKVETASDGADLSQAQDLERAARERGLSLLRFSGNLGALLRLDSPALLELSIPGTQDRRFIALTGVKGDLLQTRPAVAGKEWISPVELERYWTGQGFIPWKNSMTLPSLGPGSTGESVRILQGLLAESKVYGGAATGVYDGETLTAVRTFQAANGLGQDGVAGQRTLILLYRSIARFQTPGLNR